jgi:hypothetical protein
MAVRSTAEIPEVTATERTLSLQLNLYEANKKKLIDVHLWKTSKRYIFSEKTKNKSKPFWQTSACAAENGK